MSKPFEVIIKGSFGAAKRRIAFPSFQNLLKNGETMTITEVWSDEKTQKILIKDQNGRLHEGIEINVN